MRDQDVTRGITVGICARGRYPAGRDADEENREDPHTQPRGPLAAPLVAGVLLCALLLLWLPAAAMAHGQSAPVATSYVARVSRVPAGLTARIVNGDLRVWLRVPPRMTVVVIDYRGAPYLRFSRTGVEVNENSSMYYLNEKPISVTPPLNLTRSTPARWKHVSGAHVYAWNDGRLHALAMTVVSPATTYEGRWSIPLRVDGRPASLSGGVWHRADPTLAWFWPIVALVACALAGWRIRSPSLDARLVRVIGIVALLAIAVAGSARELYGRPSVPVFHIVEVAAILTFVVWAIHELLARRPGYFSLFLISVLALWEGLELIPTLTHGYALTATPGFVARAATVLCLGTGTALLLFVFRLARAMG